MTPNDDVRNDLPDTSPNPLVDQPPNFADALHVWDTTIDRLFGIDRARHRRILHYVKMAGLLLLIEGTAAMTVWLWPTPAGCVILPLWMALGFATYQFWKGWDW